MDDEPTWDLDDIPAADEPAAGEAAVEGDVAAEAAAPSGPREKCAPPHYTYHWVKPLVLNYRYIDDYRLNYYNDVIDWMDKRNKGIYRDKPRAQEWSERALQMYTLKNKNPSIKRTADMRDMITTSKKEFKTRYYSYHTRAFYSLKYQKIL
ncbi:flightin [Belonocnema kinseyi]|uniref:flightin n=1 Tax=Belonocnema kinseyi TaxID=2817044 RepID=UPI00143DED4B|nr:flightin [Belonocnema kinseyi]